MTFDEFLREKYPGKQSMLIALLTRDEWANLAETWHSQELDQRLAELRKSYEKHKNKIIEIYDNEHDLWQAISNLAKESGWK